MSEVVDCIAWIVRKTAWSFYVFLKFLFLMLLNLLGLIFNLLACCTIIRLPFMIAIFKNMKNFWDWRLLGIIQVLIFISDIPFIIMGLFILLTMWRIRPCYKELCDNWNGWEMESHEVYYSGWKLRAIIMKQFFKSFIDIFCIPTAFMVLISWRSVIFVRKMKKATSDSKRRRLCFIEFFQLLFDIPLLLFFVSLLSWRLPFVIRKLHKGIKGDKKWNNLRYVGIQQFFLLLLDIPCLVAFLITLLTWRSPFMIYKIREDTKNANRKWNKIEMDIRSDVMLHFILIFIDIPCIIVGVFFGIALWRLPSLIRRFRKIKNKLKLKNQRFTYRTEMKIRWAVLLEFFLIFVDIISFIGFLIVLLTLWRTYPMLKIIRKYLQRYDPNIKENKINESNEMPSNQLEIEHLNESLTVHNLEESEVIGNVNQPTETDIQIADNDIQIESNITSTENKVQPTETAIQIADNDIQIESNITSTENNDKPTDDVIHVAGNETQSTEHQPYSDAHISNNKKEIIEEEEKEADKKLSWTKCMWKIRKAIGFQFVFLFIDIPAIPLCLFLLITGLRTTRLISDLLGGNFYMLFAISVYYHFLHFIIEICFIFLFLLLIIMKPIQTWICLLEDEEHKKYRLLRHIMQWIPDVIQDRQKQYLCLEEILFLNFKQNHNIYNIALREMNNEFDPFLNRIQDILNRVDKYEIEDEFVYLVKCIQFAEKKRTNKLLRTFYCERNFVQRPNMDIHLQNMNRLKHESINYDCDVDNLYKQLENYQPTKVPLYENKSGMSLRTRDETKKVLIETLPRGGILIIVGFILCCLPLYRAPSLVKRLIKRWYNRIEIMKDTLYEYGLDMLTILRMTFVLIFLYRAPFMLADVVDCIIEKRSWRAVRKVVKNYPGIIVDDIINLLVCVMSWKTPRFLFTATLFGALMPGELFLTVSKSCSQNKCVAYLLALSIYIVLVGFPFVFSYYGAQEIMEAGLVYTNVTVLCVFFFLLLLILLLMVMTLTRDPKKNFLLIMPQVDYIRYSWYNFHVVLFEVLEFFQAIALIFKVTTIPMYGSHTLSVASKYLLFSFLPFEPIFWTTVTFFIIWFFLCGAPIIFENILETFAEGTMGKRPSWRLAVSLFANTLFVTFVENLVSFSACTYGSSLCTTDLVLPLGNFTGNINGSIFSNMIANNTLSNTSCVTATFVEDNSYHCWSSPHRNYAAFGLIALVWYTTTALIFDTQYGDPDTTEQDIGFSPIYNTVLNIFKAMMVVCITIMTNDPNAALICLLVLNVLSIVFTFVFKIIFKFYPCNVTSFLVWRVCTFVSSSIVVIAVLIAYAIDDENSKIPLIIIGTGIGSTILISLVITLRLRRVSKTEKDREDFRIEIRMLEKRLGKNKWFLKGWDKKRNIWLRLVKSVRNAQKHDKILVPIQQQTNNSELPLKLFVNEEGGSVPPLPTLQQPPPPPQENIQGDTLKDLNLPPPPSFEAVERSRGLYDIATVQAATFSDEILKLEKNGRNLLIVLEKYVDHKAYRYAFFIQRQLWLSSAWNCNWTNLLQCLRVLNANLQGTFDHPTQLDVSLGQTALDSDLINDDYQDTKDPPQPFVRQTKEMIENTSRENREKALNDFQSSSVYGNEWKLLFEKLLPDLPVIRSWEFNHSEFELILKRPVTGTIIEIEDNGNKLAKGASVKIGKKLAGTLTGSSISFSCGKQPSGSKGPATVTLEQISFVEKKNKLYLVVNGKNKVPFDTVLASSKTFKWE